MKIFKNIILFLFISIIFITKIEAYDLSKADKIKWDILTRKIENYISKYWENTRKAQIVLLKASKKDKNTKNTAIIDYVIKQIEINNEILESIFWNDNNYSKLDLTYCPAKNIVVNWRNYSVSKMNIGDIKDFVYQKKTNNSYQNYKQSFSCTKEWIKTYWYEIAYLPVCNDWYYMDWDYCTYDYDNPPHSSDICYNTTQYVNWHTYTIDQMNNWNIKEFSFYYNIYNWYQIYKQSFKCNNWYLITYWVEKYTWTYCSNWYYKSWNYCIYNNNSYNYHNNCSSTIQYINWHIYNIWYLNHNEKREYSYQKEISNWYITYRQYFKCYDWYLSSYWSEKSSNPICYSWYYQNWDYCTYNYNAYSNCSSTTTYVNWHTYNIWYLNNGDIREYTYQSYILNWYITYRQVFKCDNWYINSYWNENHDIPICYNWYYQSWNNCIR